jgi:hypothetical protein
LNSAGRLDFEIIDCHLHCGVQNVSWGWEHKRPLLTAAGIRGVGLIPPVEDIYDRYDPEFLDTPAWQACRRRAHQYLLNLREACRSGADDRFDLYPYFFVWNDFAWEDLGPEYLAIKWHRHPYEPRYQYDHPRCREFLQAVRQRRLPILLEESFDNTLFFLERLAPDLPVIIPHLGGLNGGYGPLKAAGVWNRPQTYADTAIAAPAEIEDFLGRYGSDRLLFGSDHPFGEPQLELAKIFDLNLPLDQARAVLGDNFRRIYGLTSFGCCHIHA